MCTGGRGRTATMVALARRRSPCHQPERFPVGKGARKGLENAGSVCHGGRNNRRCAMSQLEVADNTIAPNTERASSAYVPSLQRTAGQPPPIAANGGLSYMSFDRDGDAGTATAIQDALAEISEGEGQR